MYRRADTEEDRRYAEPQDSKSASSGVSLCDETVVIFRAKVRVAAVYFHIWQEANDKTEIANEGDRLR